MKKSLLLTFLFIILSFASAIAKERKAVYIVVDGIPADYIERVHPTVTFDIAAEGSYGRAYTGGDKNDYTLTPTVSAIGYTNILTGTWMNKHNVDGNSRLKPNYNYWTIFRVAKEQKRRYTTALFSSWVDNRTVLIGAGKPETGNLSIDYVADGYELDTINFAPKKDELHIFDIDSLVCRKAAECLRTNAPHLSWVYLWYTDSGFHIYGDSDFMDHYVRRTDALLQQIWDAVKYREANFDEEWMVIVTTDHGRTDSGHGHGGQSERERSVWISTNVSQVNEHFTDGTLSLVDIHPTICSWMGWELDRDRRFELDGVPFVGKADIHSLSVNVADNTATLRWKNLASKKVKATVYLATSDNFAGGGKDKWIKVATTSAHREQCTIDLSQYPTAQVYKFVVSTPNTAINRHYITKGR